MPSGSEAGVEAARRAAERAARTSYGRLVAILAARTRDIAAAEDALAEAFRIALSTWPDKGIPDAPEAWLLTAARRTLAHAHRHAGVRARAADHVSMLQDELAEGQVDGFPDERLKLLFICAHPAIDEGVRTPLMLQTVLGLDAARIAAAFLVAPAAMGQRLVRAKAKIRDAGISFAAPEPAEWPERLTAVLDAIYAAFGAGWDDALGADAKRKGLADEAIFLARLLVQLLPDEPEGRGLLALMLHCEARRPARRADDGAFIPLRQQDPRLWSADMIIAAERELAAAAQLRRFGRYQTEAAIQSLHAQAAVTGRLNTEALLVLYDVLAAQAGSIGALCARAAAYGEHRDAAIGLAQLDELPAERVAAHQPYWATRAHLLAAAGERMAAADAFGRAIGLTEDPATRLFLERARTGLAH